MSSFFIYSLFAMAGVAGCCCVGNVLGALQHFNAHPLPLLFVKARLWKALMCLTIAVACVVRLYIDLPAMGLQYTLSASICFIYTVACFLAFGYSPSFDKHFIGPVYVSISLLLILAVWGLFFLVFHFDMEPTYRLVIIAFMVFFIVADLLVLYIHIYVSYTKRRRAVENYYSEDYRGLNIMAPLALGILLLYVMGWIFMPFFSSNVFGVYLIIGSWLLFIAFVLSERFYTVVCHKPHYLDVPDDEEAVEEAAAAPLTDEEFVASVSHSLAGIREWIERRGYCQQGITIEMLARELHTNRTYLSSHVNNRYNMSFRVWIGSLRVAEAKKLLAETALTEREIAEQLGFGAMQSFIRTFTQLEHCTPSEYRAAHSILPPPYALKSARPTTPPPTTSPRPTPPPNNP